MSDHRTGRHDGTHAHHHRGCCGGHAERAAKPDARATDPVCGMTVDPATSKHRAEHEGRTFHFCSAGCRTKFVADPARYLHPKRPEAAEPAPARPDAIYTCPMHPQVRRVGPGTCPICGMALEPEVATEDTGPNPELVDFTRRSRNGG